MDLQDYQFEILPTQDADSGVGFGQGLDIAVDEAGFQPGSTEWGTQDSENANDGSTAFGRDRLLGPTWGWDLFTNKADAEGAVAAIGQLSTAWRAREIRNDPGAVLAVRYALAGRTRRIYGRPRNFDAPPTNLILSGMVPVTCDFKCVDAYTYDDVLTTVAASASASGLGGGGFAFPTTFPASTLPPSQAIRDSAAVVGGDAETFPIIRFQGPTSTPTLEVTSSRGSWSLTVDIELGPLDVVDVDLRPWKRTILLNGTQSLAGKLGRRQWLADMFLEPGDHLFSASALGGEPLIAVSWRNAWNSI